MSEALQDKLAELARRFAAQAPEQAETVRSLVREDDMQALGMLAHGLAGHAGMLGHPRIGEAALEIEELIDRGADPVAAINRLLDLLDAL